jgi:hypothetical protein
MSTSGQEICKTAKDALQIKTSASANVKAGQFTATEKTADETSKVKTSSEL